MSQPSDSPSQNSSARAEDLARIRDCLLAVADLVSGSDLVAICASHIDDADPSTALDRQIDRLLFGALPRPGEGWLSEESQATPDRLHRQRVWVVDPIDGTREFVQGIPEWCVSIALIEDRQAVAGGVLNPSTGELFLGSVETGFAVEGAVPSRLYRSGAARSCLLVSRREHSQGKWTACAGKDLEIVPVASIAYRLALVAAGYADATGTFEPRREWDIAGGVALVLAAGGRVQKLDGSPIRFNNPIPRVENAFAFGAGCAPLMRTLEQNAPGS